MHGTGSATNQRHTWIDQDLEQARNGAHAATGSAARAAATVRDALTRDPRLAPWLNPMIERLLVVADHARTVEHELAALQAERRRGRTG